MKITSSRRLTRPAACVINILLFVAVSLHAGCADQEEDSQQEHVWQQQTDALDRARTVEGILEESAEERQRQIQQQSQY